MTNATTLPAGPRAESIRELMSDMLSSMEAHGVIDADFFKDLTRQVGALLARPIPDVTRNAGYTVRAVMAGHPAEPGLLASWWVACESTADNQWVTWEAYALDGSQAGRLGYNGGHYFDGPDQAVNKRRALADLAVRAGTMPEVAVMIADEVVRHHPEHGPYTPSQQADRRMAARLRRWAGR